MLFGAYTTCRYLRPPVAEVICQLRFPAIPSLAAEVPTAFQKAVHSSFPSYQARQEQQQPKLVPGPPPRMEAQPPLANHYFVSGDGRWKLNLTRDFIALSTLSYPGWAEFRTRLDQVLAQFEKIYHPDHFLRAGLRYLNAFSRRQLGMSDLLWDDIIETPFLGILSEPDVDESSVSRCIMQVESTLPDGTSMKIQSGPGLLGGGKVDKEPKFILDGDFSRLKDLTPDRVSEHLEALHRHAVCLFQGAITSETHQAMGPVEEKGGAC